LLVVVALLELKLRQTDQVVAVVLVVIVHL